MIDQAAKAGKAVEVQAAQYEGARTPRSWATPKDRGETFQAHAGAVARDMGERPERLLMVDYRQLAATEGRIPALRDVLPHSEAGRPRAAGLPRCSPEIFRTGARRVTVESPRKRSTTT